jgi:2-polyprenyl-3-methyl-5-hydroxy-6-metoxy-1,4-benzoquinol methylase
VYKDYGFPTEAPAHTHEYLIPAVLRLCPKIRPDFRVLDVGCGNGAMAAEFLRRGCSVVGIDPSQQGINIARKAFPSGRFEILSCDEYVLQHLGTSPFDLVICTEVIEHIYDPRSFMRGCFDATKAGGRFICSTPYHGYLKNLSISVLGKWDRHFSPLWDGGHIKFWSRGTLSTLLTETGFKNLRFEGAGRFSLFWMSMVFSGDKSAS